MIGSAVLCASAQAQSSGGQVDLFGALDSFVGSTKVSGAPASTAKVGNGGLTSSFWGMKGNEDLGGGMHAIFDLQSYVLIQNGQAGRTTYDSFFSYNAYVGLSGPFGTVTFGQQANPLFLAQARFNPFSGSITLNPVIVQSYLAAYGRALAGDDEMSNAVLYQSPVAKGLSTTLAYSFGNVAGAPGTNNVLAMLDYTNNAFAATAGMERIKIPTYPNAPAANLGAASDQLTVHAAASYDFTWVKLNAEYQRTNNGGVARKDNIGQIGATIRINPFNAILASWARDYITYGRAPHVYHDTASIAYDYLLSARTDTYLAYSYDKVSDLGTGNTVIAGIRHRF